MNSIKWGWSISLRRFQSLWILFAVALGVRFLLLAFGPGTADDDGTYLIAVNNYFSGRGYAYAQSFPYPDSVWYSWLPPLYGVLVIISYKLFGIGSSLMPLRLLITVLGAVSCVWLFHVGRRLGGERLGWLAGYGLALYPPQALDATSLNPHPVSNALFVGAVLLIIKSVQDGRRGMIFAAGLTWGVVCLSRAEFFSLVPWVCLWALLFITPKEAWHDWRGYFRTNLRRGAPLAACFGVGVFLAMSPWIIRNWNLHHRFIPLATNYGENLYFSFNPSYHFTGEATYHEPEKMRARMEGLSEPEMADLFLAEAYAYIRADWGRFARTLVGNAWQFWRPYLSTKKYGPLKSAAYAVFWLPVFGLFLAGLFLVPWKSQPIWILLGGMVATKFAGHLLFYVIVRFREAMSPMFILFAAAAALHLYATWKSKPVDFRAP